MKNEKKKKYCSYAQILLLYFCIVDNKQYTKSVVCSNS